MENYDENKFEEINPEFYLNDEDKPVEGDSQVELDELSQEFVNKLIEKIMDFLKVLVGHDLHPYQKPLARRIIESVIINDGEEITALASRQSGKSETVADTVATLMILLPRLAKLYPDLLGKFKDGIWVGLFAPTEGQAETLFGRTVTRLTSERALEILGDPEIDDSAARVGGVTRQIKLKKSGSTITMMTANPRAKIESKSFHLIVIDECQEADDFVVSKSISPMLAYYAGTMVKTGTPTTSKNNFYRSIQLNKRRQTGRNSRQNHFQWDWKDVAKIQANYEKFIRKEMLRIGEDSDEFQMSYNCLTPDTKVLTKDLRYVEIGSVQVGDVLVGFDEEAPTKGAHRKIRETVVTKAERIFRPTYEIALSDGTVVKASDGHLWLVSTASRRTVWKRTDELSSTDRIFKIFDTWEHVEDYRTGYLASAFDGEGHFSRQAILGFSQRENVMLGKVRKYLDALGFKYWERKETGTNNDVTVLHIAGGRASISRFLGQIRPERLLKKVDLNSLGSIGRHDFVGQDFEHPIVLSVTSVGEREVVALETTTQTFIAEGLASHNCKWLLERGMFVTSTIMDDLGDTSAELVKSWHKTPVVVGIDPARKTDSTVVTVVFVDWERPDEFGYFEHRILNWLEMQGDDWEEQYFQIVNFLQNYDVLAVGVDGNGVGDAVAQRLKLLMPRSEVVALTSSPSEQSKRWKHLQALIQRKMITWPAHAKTRRLRTWKRFYQQMTDLEVTYKGPNFAAAAPDEAYSHDDFADSLSIACSLTQELVMPEVSVSTNVFFR
jgi:hypothetical protein